MLECFFGKRKQTVYFLKRWESEHKTFHFLNRFQANIFGLYLIMLLL